MRIATAPLLPILLAGALTLLLLVPEGARSQAPSSSPGASAAAPPASSPASAPSTVTLVGLDGRTREFTASMLAGLPVARVSATAHDKTVAYTGADLLDVLRAAGTDLPDRLRGASMRLVLLAQGADGYTVAFSFAELDASLGARKVYLVNRGDDKPLAEDGPWRLIVPQDARAARWVRQLSRLTVVAP
jgi:hypothetical protein